MLYLEEDLLLEALEKKETIRFTTPIVYNRIIQRNILRLVETIFNQEDECVCDDALFELVNSFTANTHQSGQKDRLITSIKKRNSLFFKELQG